MSKKFIGETLIGKQFEKWTVLEFVPNDKPSSYWLCECSCDKKTKKPVNRKDLISGRSKSCGCLRKPPKPDIIDMTGWTFGRLKVLEQTDERKNRNVVWKCECSCENKTIKYFSSNELRSGRTNSCGCARIETITKDLLGKTFGLLTAIEKTEQRDSNGEVIWKCKCSCSENSIHYVRGSKLTSGNILSCGCVKSHGERNIKQILDNSKIDYKVQFSFDDLLSNKGFKLFFDFAIFKNDKLDYLIEFDGLQHEKPCFRQSNEEFLETQERDKLKNKYCLNNNIPLIRISYKYRDIMELSMLQLETSKFIYRGE